MSVWVIFLLYPSQGPGHTVPGWRPAKLPPIVENIRSEEISDLRSEQNKVFHPVEISVKCSTDGQLFPR